MVIAQLTASTKIRMPFIGDLYLSEPTNHFTHRPRHAKFADMETFSIVPLSLSRSTTQHDVNIVKVEHTLAHYHQKNASYAYHTARLAEFFRKDEYIEQLWKSAIYQIFRHAAKREIKISQISFL